MPVIGVLLLALLFSAPAVAQADAPPPGEEADPGAAFERAQFERLVAATELAEARRFDDALQALEAIDAHYRAHYADRIVIDVRTMPEAKAAEALVADRPGSILITNTAWSDALYERAYLLVDIQRLDEAEPLLRRAIAMAPTNTQYRIELGHIQQTRRQWQDAFDTFVEAERYVEFSDDAVRRDDRMRVLRGQGYQLIEMGRLDEAEARYRAVLAIDPKESGALTELDYIAQLRRKAN